MRDRERPGQWWLSVDGPMSVQRVVAGWTRLVEAKACLTSRIRATDTFLNLSTQSSGHTGCNPAGISKRVIQPGLFQYFNFFYHLRCQGKVLGTKSNLYKTFQERFCSQELKKHLSFFSFFFEHHWSQEETASFKCLFQFYFIFLHKTLVSKNKSAKICCFYHWQNKSTYLHKDFLWETHTKVKGEVVYTADFFSYQHSWHKFAWSKSQVASKHDIYWPKTVA